MAKHAVDEGLRCDQFAQHAYDYFCGWGLACVVSVLDVWYVVCDVLDPDGFSVLVNPTC